jgi:type IV pilus assembly protein PilC
MARFYYVARKSSGERETGTEEAASQDEVVSRLQTRNLIVIKVTAEYKESVAGPMPGESPKAKIKHRHYRITTEDLTLFCRQLATLLGAGVTVLKCLDVIKQQVASRRLFNVIKDLQKSMEAGLSLHEAMAKYPVVFGDLWVNLVESGEASGNLALVLNRLAAYLERSAEFRSKIVSALIYPCILLVGGLGALLFLTIRIIPTFAEIFKGFNLTLPFLTQVLIRISDFIRKYLLIVLIAVIAGFWLLRNYIKTKPGRRVFERFLFALPVFGGFFRVYVIERFTSEMATLVESGVPILYSLEISGRSVGNLTLADIIDKIKGDVREGKPLSQPLEKSGFFDPMAVQMIAIGEEIGELSNMFKRLNTFYQEYIDTFLTRFTTMFEPIMLIFMGLVIGTMVIGMFLPIFQLTRIR